MIVGKYSEEWEGDIIHPQKSYFTMKGYDLEVKSWNYPSIDESKLGKWICNLYMIEHTPAHPGVMGKVVVYENDSFAMANPFFEDDKMQEIQTELYKLAKEINKK